MKLRYLADGLSALRAILVVPILIAGWQHQWKVAFALLVVAHLTDLLDGAAARRYGSRRDVSPDFDADGLADSILLFGITFVPVFFYTGQVRLTLSAVWVLTAVGAIAMVVLMKKPEARWLIAFNMIVLHGAIQIGAATSWYAYMAYGWAGTIFTGGVLLVTLLTQRHKMALWFSGKFS